MLTPLCTCSAFFLGPEFTLGAALFSGPFGRMGVPVARTPVRSPRRLRPPFMIEPRRHHVVNIDLATTAPMWVCWPTAASFLLKDWRAPVGWALATPTGRPPL